MGLTWRLFDLVSNAGSSVIVVLVVVLRLRLELEQSSSPSCSDLDSPWQMTSMRLDETLVAHVCLS